MVNKNMLNIDGRYQREASLLKVMSIARNWDWSLFGTIGVAERSDGTLWVYSGGHRVRASFYRNDIKELPCMIFRLEDLSEEARSFLLGAITPSNICPFDRYKAMIAIQDSIALETKEILNELDVAVMKTANNERTLKCIQFVLDAVAINKHLAKRCLKLCIVAAGENPIKERCLSAFFNLALHFKDRDILTEFADKIDRLSQDEILRKISSLEAETNSGGQKIYALSLMQLINKGKRTRQLKW